LTETAGRFRELFAWLLIGAAVLRGLALFVGLFTGLGFEVKAVSNGPRLTEFAGTLMIVLAVALASRFGEPTPNAKTVSLLAMIGLALLGVLALVTVVVTVTSEASTGEKLSLLVMHIAQLLAVGGGVFFALLTMQGLPAQQQAGAQFGQFGAQPQGAFGQPGGQAPQGQFGAYGQQPGQPQPGQAQPGFGQPAAAGAAGAAGFAAGEFGQQAPAPFGQEAAQQPAFGQPAG